MFNVLFFVSTPDFALTLFCNWYPSMRLLRFNLFLTQEHNLRSTWFIYVRRFIAQQLADVVEFSSVFTGRHFETQRAVCQNKWITHLFRSCLSSCLLEALELVKKILNHDTASSETCFQHCENGINATLITIKYFWSWKAVEKAYELPVPQMTKDRWRIK